MPLTEPYELDGVTVGATELSIVSGTTTLQTVTDDGIYSLWLDPVGAALAKGDYYKTRVYETVKGAGTKRLVLWAVISQAQAQPWTFPKLALLHGWDMTLQKLAGTDRAWDASIRATTGAGLTQRSVLDAVTVGATELSIVSGTTTLQTIAEAGHYQTWVDPFNMAKGDEYVLRVYEKVEGTGGTKRIAHQQRLAGPAAKVMFTPWIELKNGWDATLQKIAGTDRAFDASIRKVA